MISPAISAVHLQSDSEYFTHRIISPVPALFTAPVRVFGSVKSINFHHFVIPPP